jgi:LmbE family N-acetylglucosaminyl deacetylase
MAQLEPPGTGGVVALDQELRMLGHRKRVLMIGAHPDDEDTELLAILVREMGAEAAYLSLNRGEGGQNLIGPELGEALGLIRTEELLAARRLDGARQYFTRAYDFGFSKTLEETWEHWPRDSVLKDVVRVVRTFRPQIVVSVFSGTPRDGHGQHQAAGWAAREAYRIAGDAARFPELRREEGLDPWRPLKLYRSTRFDTAATTLGIEGGVLDSVLGKTYHQIAMAGRSLHRSQDMGQLQAIGPSRVRLALLDDRTGAGAAGLFAGVDTTLPPAVSPARLAALRGDPSRAAGLRPALAAEGPGLEDQLARLDSVIAMTSGTLCDAIADDERVVPGQRLRIGLTCWNTKSDSIRVQLGLRLAGRPFWDTTLALAGRELRSIPVDLPIPDSLSPTTPYFLRTSRRGDMYVWPADTALAGVPREPAWLMARFGWGGGAVSTREVSFRFNDQARGEIRRPVIVVPRVDLKVDPASEVWSALDRGSHRFRVTLTHGARDTTAGTVTLEPPPGWPAVPARPFRLTREDQRESFSFKLRPPAGRPPGEVHISAVARDAAGREYRLGSYVVDYPHIRPRAYTVDATATVRIANLALPRLARVGYIRGASDRVPEALRSVGLPLTLLDAGTIEQGNLDRYDVIVIGPRAYETDSALVENNDRLLAYARRGGLLLVQYQQHQFFNGGFAPFPLTVGGQPLRLSEETGAPRPQGSGPARPPTPPVSHDRVTEEDAPVRLLAPRAPVARWPNRLNAEDWRGWVQERGLYFARSWDPAYRPVLETHDTGEAPLEGGLLIARLGRGTYVYTGLSFFRQLPAAVPGAFRLFANLLALSRHASR